METLDTLKERFMANMDRHPEVSLTSLPSPVAWLSLTAPRKHQLVAGASSSTIMERIPTTRSEVLDAS